MATVTRRDRAAMALLVRRNAKRDPVALGLFSTKLVDDIFEQPLQSLFHGCNGEENGMGYSWRNVS